MSRVRKERLDGQLEQCRHEVPPFGGLDVTPDELVALCGGDEREVSETSRSGLRRERPSPRDEALMLGGAESARHDSAVNESDGVDVRGPRRTWHGREEAIQHGREHGSVRWRDQGERLDTYPGGGTAQ